MADHIPTVRQRRLAQALRELRREAGLTQDAVGVRMGWHTSKLFRLENARSPRVDWLDVKELMEMYGVRSPHREALIQLARDARMRGWWTPYRDVFTGSYVALEDESSAMRLYSSARSRARRSARDTTFLAVSRSLGSQRRITGRNVIVLPTT